MASRGLGNKEIAALLYVSETTVKKRLSRLMRILGVDNRVSLVREAIGAGLVDPHLPGGEDRPEIKGGAGAPCPNGDLSECQNANGGSTCR